MRIVADTNLFIASIFWNGVPYRIIEQALDGKIEIYTSNSILDEIRKVLSDEKEGFMLSKQEIDDIISSILNYAKLIESMPIIDIELRDAKDIHIVSCAIAAKAEHIVTRDKDLLVLKNYKQISILTPEEFIKIIN